MFQPVYLIPLNSMTGIVRAFAHPKLFRIDTFKVPGNTLAGVTQLVETANIGSKFW